MRATEKNGIELTRVRRRLIARVFLGRRSRGLYFLPLNCSRCACRAFWFITVNTLAIDLRTDELEEYQIQPLHGRVTISLHIFVSFEAEPPATFCTRSVRSSFLNSVSCFERSGFDLEVLSEPGTSRNGMVHTWIEVRRL